MRSRTVWFFLQRVTGNGFGFALTAVLTRVVPLGDLAEFLAAYAFASIFEPIFGAALNLYLIRLLRDSRTKAETDLIMKSVFLLMQAASVVGVLALMGVQFSDPRTHLFSVMIFLQIVFTPWKLFTAPLFIRDRFIDITSVQVLANILGGAGRIAVLLLTRNLLLVALLMCVEPIVVGLLLMRRSGIAVLSRPFVSPKVVRQVSSHLPSLMGAMVLVCLFWRSPILLARWQLPPIDVVHIAICSQVIAGLSIIQATLCESLTGPLAKASSDDAAFIKLLRIGSSVAFLCGAGALAGVALFGDWVLTTVFGERAAGSAILALCLTPLCLLGGMNRLITVVINLRGRPVYLIYTWLAANLGQIGAMGLLLAWRDPLVIVLMTPASLLLGLAVGGLAPTSIRKFSLQVFFGFTSLLSSARTWREMLAIMLGAGPPRARHAVQAPSA